MGYYIEVPENLGKAEQLVKLHGGEIVPRPQNFTEVPADKGLICVVNNGLFEAAGYCYNTHEFIDFAQPDGRSRQWVLLDKNKAERLSGYKR